MGFGVWGLGFRVPKVASFLRFISPDHLKKARKNTKGEILRGLEGFRVLV